MTRYPVASNGLPLVRWGPAAPAPPERQRTARRPGLALARSLPGTRFAGAAEVAAGLLLLVGWVLLWSFFLCAVVEPGSRLLRVTMEEHPSLSAPAATAGGPVSVDTDGGLP